jgi:23S rRNA (cytidine2498-2'-O)-methyltransferase
MTTGNVQFVFMTCRPGAEAALKQEVARLEPDWRLAFSRSGFLTFKLCGDPCIDERQLAERHWTLAHAHGFSWDRQTGPQLRALVERVWGMDDVRTQLEFAPIADIHVWEPIPAPGLEPDAGFASTPLCQEVESALRAAAPESCPKLRRTSKGVRRPAPRNGRVLDVVILSPSEWWIGHHCAVTWTQRWPGGVIPVSAPAHAVSRAYAKLEEAIAWSGLPISAGDECVEIGCAPGGASQSLLDRGLFVTGIDPAEVDPTLLAHPKFRQLKKRGHDVRRHEFLGVRWLLADMNIAPQDTLDEVEAIVTHRGVTIQGMVLTLKLADWSLAERVPDYVGRVRGWGYRDVRVRQLTTGGQEVCLVALRRKALRRLTARPGHSRGHRSRRSAVLRRDPPHRAPSGPHF